MPLRFPIDPGLYPEEPLEPYRPPRPLFIPPEDLSGSPFAPSPYAQERAPMMGTGPGPGGGAPSFLDRLAMGFSEMGPFQSPRGASDLQAFLAALAHATATSWGRGRTRQNALGAQERQALNAESVWHARTREAANLRAQERHQGVLQRSRETQAAERRAIANAEDKAYRTERGQRRAAAEIETPAERNARARADAVAGRAGKTQGRFDQRFRLSSMNYLNTAIRVDPELKDYVVIRDQYTTGLDARNAKNSAGDIVLMRALARATDPRTGVREEEYRTFAGAQGALLRQGMALTSGMVGKGQLTEFGREQLLRRIQSIKDRKQVQSGRSIQRFRRQAVELGLDPEMVMQDYSPANPDLPTPDAYGEGDSASDPLGILR